MEDLFRFHTIRPPSEVDDKRAIKLDQATQFVQDLRQALTSQGLPIKILRYLVRLVAYHFIKDGYTDSIESLNFGKELKQLGEVFSATEAIHSMRDQTSSRTPLPELRKPPLKRGSRGDIVKALQRRLNELGFKAGEIDGIFGDMTKSAVCDFQRQANITVDGKVGINTWQALQEFNDEEQEIDLSNLAIFLDDIERVIEQVTGMAASEIVEQETFRNDRNNASDAIIAIKLLQTEHSKPLADLVSALRLINLIERVSIRDTALQKISSLENLRAQLELPLKLPSSIFPLPQPKTTVEPSNRVIDNGSNNEELNSAREAVDRLNNVIEELMELKPEAFVEYRLPDSPHNNGAPDGNNSPSGDDGSISFFTLKPEVSSQLSEETQQALVEMSLDATEVPFDQVVSRFMDELNKNLRTIARLEPERPGEVAVLIGTSLFTLPTDSFGLIEDNTASIPITHASIRPAGVADLLIVKQQLKGYEAREIAHVENVLKGETKEREHRRATTTEEFFFTESETTSEEENELQSTERFELKNQVEDVVKQDRKLEAGVNVTARYGFALEVQGYAKGAISNSRQKSTQRASKYAVEVTSRAVSKIAERVKEQYTLRTTQEIEETNHHELHAENDHVVGMYQWIEKVYEAQVFNYGRRTMYDFIIPEPAIFVIEALKQDYAKATNIEKPKELDLHPWQLSIRNYINYVKEYDVTDVDLPPEEFITVSHVFKNSLYDSPVPEKRNTDGDGDTSASSQTKENKLGVFADAGLVTIPSGYEAVYGSVTVNVTVLPITVGSVNGDPVSRTPRPTVNGTIGNKSYTMSPASKFYFQTNLDNVKNNLPVAISTHETSSYSASIIVKCKRTEHGLDAWKLNTYKLIVQGYEKKLSEYEEKLAVLQAQAGVEISGRHSEANRKLERDELKKYCISFFTKQHFDLFDAVEQSDDSEFSQIDLDEAEKEGRYIRFFEQAFEWENMTYTFYPYFWGRKGEDQKGERMKYWVERFNHQDTDPRFEDFLKAGACRAVVPAREGFEAAIQHFMDTGETWNGGELPDVTSNLYVPIVEEIREQLNAPGDEVPQGEPWEVRVPTRLVYLRQDSSLPKWEKNAEGNWVPNN